jgi:hypothetical protein
MWMYGWGTRLVLYGLCIFLSNRQYQSGIRHTPMYVCSCWSGRRPTPLSYPVAMPLQTKKCMYLQCCTVPWKPIILLSSPLLACCSPVVRLLFACPPPPPACNYVESLPEHSCSITQKPRRHASLPQFVLNPTSIIPVPTSLP